MSLPRSRFSFRYAYCKSGFNLLLEIVGTEDTIRLGGLSDSPKQLRIDVHPKQVPVNRLPLSGFCPQPEIIFVRLNQRVWLAERVTMVAAPAVIGRTLRDVGTNGVELNVPVTDEEIPVTLHQACVISTFPQRAASAVRVVDVPHVAATGVCMT
jgi:hypothetical protein